MLPGRRLLHPRIAVWEGCGWASGNITSSPPIGSVPWAEVPDSSPPSLHSDSSDTSVKVT